MSIQVLGGLKAVISGSVGGYGVAAVGDGSSTTVSVDFYRQIADDDTVPNKSPTGISTVSSSTETPVPSASLSGSVVTFTWSTAPANGHQIILGVVLTFDS